MKLEFSREEKEALCRQAPEFIPVVAALELEDRECNGDLFQALTWSIVSQQLSGRVAQVICDRVEALTGPVSPEAIRDATFDQLRACGLSARKIEYLKGIAAAALSGTIDFHRLAGLADAAVIAELTQLKGVGVWTAEMLLIFALGRKDVLSFKDLGIRRGIMLLNRLDELTETEFERCRRRYSPHGTLASLYLWQIKDAGFTENLHRVRNKGRQ